MFFRIVATSFAGVSFCLAAGAGNQNDFGGKRVLVIGIDGLRSDALQQAKVPALKRLMASGVTTYTAQAGGELGGLTQQPTISGPGWLSILTGTYMNRHGISGNGTEPYDADGGYQVTAAPHFAKHLKDKFPSASVCSISSWGWIESYLIAPQAGLFDIHEKGEGNSYATNDADVLAKTLSCLETKNPDVLFVHFDQVDGAGHGTGFGPENPIYMEALETVDSHIGRILDAIGNREAAEQESWMVMIVTDHGGTGRSHGGQSPEERDTPMIVMYKGCPKGLVEPSKPGLHVVPATTFGHLGIAVDPAWNWQPGTFGFPPHVKYELSGDSVNLHWSKHPQAVTGIGIQRDGALVKTLPPTATEYRDTPPGDGEPHDYTIAFQGTPDTRSLTATVPRPPDIASDLVLHLPFDGNVKDKSRKGNDGTAVSATFADDGKNGGAFVLDASSSVDLGQPADLQFGADTDFTVSFWLKTGDQWENDPSIISNKEWQNGANPGWIIAGASGDLSWQWNLAGTETGRIDFDPSPEKASLSDRAWHLITVTHKRGKNASFYHDGILLGTRPINGSGNIDTGNPIRIGRDGTNQIPFDKAVQIDDMRIWRRSLNADDVAELFKMDAR